MQCTHLTLTIQPHYCVKQWPWKSQFSQEDFCLPVKFARKVFFTDENNFFLNPPVKHQNHRVWSAGKKKMWTSRLVVERAKFVSHVNRHAPCWCVLWQIRKTAFHFSQGNRKWQTLPWKSVTRTGWRLQVSFVMWFNIPAGQSACSHGKAGSKLDSANCNEFVGKDKWPPNSSDLNPLGYHSCAAMLQRYKTFQPKPNTIDELKSLAVHMGRSATELYQQGHTEQWTSSKNFELVWKLGPDTLNTSWDKLFSQSFELVASNVFFWFQYKHYDENCDFHIQRFTW